MKKIKDIEFDLLLQDKSFINRVIDESEETKKYLDELIREFPDKKETILFAVDFVRSRNKDKRKLSSQDRAQMWANIQKTHNDTSLPFRSSSFAIIWKIAVSVVIIFTLGFFLYQQYNSNSFNQYAKTGVLEDHAMIILSDGSEYELENNNSAIEYKSEGKEVLIKESGDATEKIKNSKDVEKVVLNQIIVPYGRRHSITLSDGTKVFLNSGSKLIFPANFTGNKREVFLSGEGFFDVAKDKDRPFVLNTNSIDVKVLGTQFNVAAYEDEELITTVLLEGSVEVARKNKLFNNSKFNLTPGQGCFYHKSSNETSISEVDVTDYVGWKDGWIKFKDQPLINVVKRIEKYYNKTIIIEDPKLVNTIISGKLVLSDQFEVALAYITKTIKAHAEQKDENSYILK